MSAQLFSLAGWTFLPNLVTGWIQSFWYGITIRAGDPKPQPGSPKYNAHRRRIYITVVSAYLLYTIYEAHLNILSESDFYRDLGVGWDASARDIKSKFRRLAAIYHPDKLGTSGADVPEGYFVHLKRAQDTLTDPVKRFAYDRFGPSVLTWQNVETMRDHIIVGLREILPYYGAGVVILYFLGMLGYLEWGRYWRWLTLVVLCTYEVHGATRPYYPVLATRIVNPVMKLFGGRGYLPFQLATMLRKMSVALFIAFNQIGPLLMAQQQQPAPQQGNEEELLKKNIDRLEAIAKVTDEEASRLMRMEMAPFAGNTQVAADMHGKVKDWLVQNTIRNDPEVRDAVGNVLKRRRTDAPAGAKGTK